MRKQARMAIYFLRPERTGLSRARESIDNPAFRRMAVLSEELPELLSDLPKRLARHRTVLAADLAAARRTVSADTFAQVVHACARFATSRKDPAPMMACAAGVPAIAGLLGEAGVCACLATTRRMGDSVSDEALALYFSSVQRVAARYDDLRWFRPFLDIVDIVAHHAPRALRPLLLNMDELLDKTTLAVLYQWAQWGARTHASDYRALMDHFALRSAESRARLQSYEAGAGGHFPKQPIALYLRAFWGREFLVKGCPTATRDNRPIRSFVDRGVVFLPDSYPDYAPRPLPSIYHAAATHAAAHILFSGKFPISDHDAAERLCIGLFEDARVEHLAAGRFPALLRLWQRFTPPLDATAEPPGSLGFIWLALVHALRAKQRDHVSFPGRDLAADFHIALNANTVTARQCEAYGKALRERLAGHLGDMDESFPAKIHYRDDNRCLWAESRDDPKPENPASDLPFDPPPPPAATAGKPMPQTATDASTRGNTGGEAGTVPQTPDEVHSYAEWDYREAVFRPNWVSVREHTPALGDPLRVATVLAHNRHVATRIERLVDSVRPREQQRRRHRWDGDEIDLDAAVNATVALRRGHTPDPRMHIWRDKGQRDLAVLVLLDLSESTNDRLNGAEQTVLELTFEATALLAWAINRIGDPFAIHGFASDGRHDVRYYRLKDFNHPYSDAARARLAGMRGGLSTRMGAAIRHAGGLLAATRKRKRLLLLLSDGEPADIDERDPRYLRQDCKKAVEQLARAGIGSYCLTLDRAADRYVAGIFGAGNYSIVDKVKKLPERLPTLFASLTT